MSILSEDTLLESGKLFKKTFQSRSLDTYAASSTQGLFIWARLTGLARLPRSRLTPISFVKISMCSYEKAGQPGYRDLGCRNRDLGNRDEIFSHMNTPARLPGWKFFNYACLVRTLTKRNAAHATYNACKHGGWRSVFHLDFEEIPLGNRHGKAVDRLFTWIQIKNGL